MSKQRRDIAEQLRQAIAAAEKRGMSRGAVAAAAKMPRSQLKRIAEGETVPKLDTAERILAAIGKKFDIANVAK